MCHPQQSFMLQILRKTQDFRYLVSSDLAGKKLFRKWAHLCSKEAEEACTTVFLLCMFGEVEPKHRENEDLFLSAVLLVNNAQGILDLFDLNLFQNVEGFPTECTFTILIHIALVQRFSNIFNKGLNAFYLYSHHLFFIISTSALIVSHCQRAPGDKPGFLVFSFIVEYFQASNIFIYFSVLFLREFTVRTPANPCTENVSFPQRSISLE